jgi:pimeloyl-ACP methyl ester carboxylesterase
LEQRKERIHLAEMGSGPLLLCCHGFPELWYSWHYQLPALAQAGYHVVAPDLRGYSQTSQPEEAEAYTQLHMVGDLVGLLDVLGEQRAILISHDWGTNLAWQAALLRPDRWPGADGAGGEGGYLRQLLDTRAQLLNHARGKSSGDEAAQARVIRRAQTDEEVH